jgi:hypothetical protein
MYFHSCRRSCQSTSTSTRRCRILRASTLTSTTCPPYVSVFRVFFFFFERGVNIPPPSYQSLYVVFLCLPRRIGHLCSHWDRCNNDPYLCVCFRSFFLSFFLTPPLLKYS